MTCRLCFAQKDDAFEIFGEKGLSLKVAEILGRHFWFQVFSDDGMSQNICSLCWSTVANFDTLYHSLKENYPHTDTCFLDFDTQFLTVANEANHIKIEPPEEIRRTDVFSSSNDSDESISDSEKFREIATNKQNRETKQPPKTKKNFATQEKYKNSIAWSEVQEKHITQICRMACSICEDFQFQKWLDMKKHYRSIHQTEGFIICSCCDKRFYKRNKILDHIVRKLNPEEFHCDFCGRNFANRESLKVHMDSHQDEDERKYKCEICAKTFVRRFKYHAHKMEHLPNEQKQFECPTCDRRFGSDAVLKYHQRLAHQPKKSAICEVCGRNFIVEAKLKAHIETVHMNIPQKKVQCNLCDKWILPASLKHHIQHAHIEVPLSERTCKICAKVSPNKKAMQNHVRTVHVEAVHMCNICDKAFKRATNLKEHMAGHTGEVLYTCPHCPKTFNSNANMHSHIKSIHRQLWEENRRGKKPV